MVVRAFLHRGLGRIGGEVRAHDDEPELPFVPGWRGLLGLGTAQLAIDVGTSSTVIFRPEAGIVLNQPSVVAVETIDGFRQVTAIGQEALNMVGKAPSHIEIVRPLRDGVIANVDLAEQMIRLFVRRACFGANFRRFRVVLCSSSGATAVERRALKDVVSNVCGGHVSMIEETVAAAIGAGIPISAPMGGMVVNIGGGSTEAAVIALGGLAAHGSIRVGGEKLDEAIASYVRRSSNLLIGEATAQRIKHLIGAATMKRKRRDHSVIVRGRNLVDGLPASVEVLQSELVEAVSEPVAQIVETVRNTLEKLKPELAADLIQHGIYLTGGAAQLLRLNSVIADATGLRVTLVDDAQTCAARGAARVMIDPQLSGLLPA